MAIGFDLAELGWNPLDWGRGTVPYIQWFAEIQKGTQSDSIGFADRMPDEGVYIDPDWDPGYFRYYPELTTPQEK